MVRLRFIHSLGFLALFLLLCSPARAEEPQKEPPAQPPAQQEEAKVTSVEVEGNKIVSTATILTKIKTRPGDRVSQQTVDEDIKRLYGTGFFTDASAELRPYQGGQMVRFRVQERPLVSGIVITGQRHFRETKLREELKTKEQELLDRRELKQDVDRIKQLYRTKGFYLVDVTTDVKVEESTNKATIFLNITEGKKLRVRRIVFEGNEHLSSRRLRKAIATKQSWSFITPGYYRPEVLKEDEERIKALYRSQGYSDAEASAQSSFDEQKRWMTIHVTVKEGPRYLVGGLTFRGVQQIPMDQVQKEMKMVSGQPFSQDRMVEDVGKIQSAYFAKGYMAASVEPATVLNPETKKVDVTYTVTEGSIAYVGRIIVKGNVKTRDTVIRRELRLNPGERYDGEKLRRSKERLYNLGYFEEVTLETVPSSDQTSQRDLVVNVKEAKTGEFSFGGGFSSVDSFIGFAEIAQRNFDIFNWPTFVGGGQEMKLEVMAGTRRRNFTLSFTEPWIFNRPYLFGFDIFHTTRTTGEGYSFELRRVGGDLRLGHTLGDYNRVDMTYRLENVNVSNVSDSASTALKNELGTNLISAVRLGYTHDTRDNVFNPKKGVILESGLEFAGTVLGGDKDFWKWTGGGGIFFQPLVENQVLEFHLTTGLAGKMGSSDSVPIFERFFAGGSDTIRGYKERRVGPRDSSTRDPVGGNSMAIFNAEYTIPVVDFLKVATFYDVGNVWPKAGDFAQQGFKSGTGAGVRIKTPFGPVKLDYGFPINPDKGERKSGRLHFSASRSF